MTVNTDVATASYTGNGTTQAFPVPFYFLLDTDLKVSRRLASTGVTSVLVLNSDYTLSGAGVQAGGTLTMTVIPATGDQLFVERDIDFVQQTAYPVNDRFPSASHEKALDRDTMGLQQLNTRLARALIRDPLGTTYDLGANTLINSGTAVNANDVPNLVQVQGLIVGGAAPALAGSNGSALVGFLQSGTSAILRTVQDKLRESISVKDFGAVGDGVTDDTAKIQSAIVAAYGKELYFPPGTYKITSSLTVLNSLTLTGEKGKATISQVTLNANYITVGDGTGPTKANCFRTVIRGLTFVPSSGSPVPTNNSAIFLNNVSYIDVEDCVFFGQSGGVNKLWNGITVVSSISPMIRNCTFAFLANSAVALSGVSGNPTTNVRLDFLEISECAGDAIFFGGFAGGATINFPIMYSNHAWCVNFAASGEGNNFVIQPDFEIDNNSDGILVSQGNVIQIIGGWIGAGTVGRTWLQTNAGTGDVVANGVAVFGLKCSLSGVNCSVIDCSITGDNATNTTAITVVGSDTQITGCKIRQFITSGIAFSGNPPRCMVSNVMFGAVGPSEITGQNFSASLLPPIITGCQSTASYNLTAATSIHLSQGRTYYSMTGATPVTSMTALGQGQRVTIQAGASTINFGTGGNIHCHGAAAIAVGAFTTVSFVCDGTDWFEDGGNYR